MTKITRIISNNRKLISISLLFFLFSALFTLLLTWKMGIHMGSYYFSPEIPGDGIATIASNWYNEYAGENDLPEPITDFYAYPFGYDRRGVPVYPLSLGLMNQLTRIIGPQAAYNVLIFLSFPLAALCMFLLIYYLTGSYGGAAVAGFFYGFSPWLTARAFNHVNLSAVYTLPLFVLAIIVFQKRRDVISACFVALILIVTIFTDLHLSLFCVFLAATWSAANFFSKKSKEGSGTRKPGLKFLDRTRLQFVLLILFIIVISAAAAVPCIKSILFEDPTVIPGQEQRGVEAAVDFSSDPWNYITPPVYSALWGGLTSDFTLSRLGARTTNEVTAYPGIMTAALAVACLYLVRKKNALSEKHGSEVEDINAPYLAGERGRLLNKTVNFSVLSVVLAFILSMPPLVYIGDTAIPTPSIVTAAIPFFRYYCRWALVVTFGLCILAGIGFALISRKWRLDKKKTAVFGLVVIALFIIDTTIVPPFRSQNIRTVPEVIEELADYPKDEPVTIYPLAQGEQYATFHYFYLQQFHQHPMLNGIKPSTEADLYRSALKDIYSPYTPRMLSALGIDKAVILNNYYSDNDVFSDPASAPFNPELMPDGYSPATETEDGYIYDISAKPAGVFPLYYSNFTSPALQNDGRSWSAMVRPTGQILLNRVSNEEAYSFSIEIENPGTAGTLSVSLEGKKILEETLPAGRTLLVIPRLELLEKSEKLELKWDGDPVSLDGKMFRASGPIDTYLLFSSPEFNEIDTPANRGL